MPAPLEITEWGDSYGDKAAIFGGATYPAWNAPRKMWDLLDDAHATVPNMNLPQPFSIIAVVMPLDLTVDRSLISGPGPVAGHPPPNDRAWAPRVVLPSAAGGALSLDALYTKNSLPAGSFVIDAPYIMGAVFNGADSFGCLNRDIGATVNPGSEGFGATESLIIGGTCPLVFFDDFEQYSAGSYPPSNWTLLNTGTATVEVFNDERVLRMLCTGSSVSRWTLPATHQSCEIYGEFYPATTFDSYPGLVVRERNDGADTYFGDFTTNRVRLARVQSGVFAEVDYKVPSPSFSANKWYCAKMKVTRNGGGWNDYSFKVWEKGTAEADAITTSANDNIHSTTAGSMAIKTWNPASRTVYAKNIRAYTLDSTVRPSFRGALRGMWFWDKALSPAEYDACVTRVAWELSQLGVEIPGL